MGNLDSSLFSSILCSLKRGVFMKLRLLCMILICMFLSGCRSKTNMPSIFGRLSSMQYTTQGLPGDISIINSNTAVNRGDFGFITIQAQPGTRYRITTSYKKGSRIVSVNQWRITDSKGQATFNWVVSPETVPGTYPAIIYGGGRSINTYHTVNP